jgi:hypothetical protein
MSDILRISPGNQLSGFHLFQRETGAVGHLLAASLFFGINVISVSAAGSSSTSATIQAKGAVSGASDGLATTSGSLSGIGATSGASAGVASTTATIRGMVYPAGSAAGAATAESGLIGRGIRSASAAGSATTTADIEAVFDDSISGETAGSSSASVTLSGKGRVAGSSAGHATGAIIFYTIEKIVSKIDTVKERNSSVVTSKRYTSTVKIEYKRASAVQTVLALKSKVQ